MPGPAESIDFCTKKDVKRPIISPREAEEQKQRIENPTKNDALLGHGTSVKNDKNNNLKIHSARK